MSLPLRLSFGLLLSLGATAMAQQTKIIDDFENEKDLRLFDYKQKSAQLVSEHSTHGGKALRISSNEYMTSFNMPRDWSGFDSLDIDVFVDGDSPINGSLLIADEAWQKKNGSYWNRHNGTFNLRPGSNVLSIPVNGLYRGEAGSRNNDIKSNIDPTRIIRVDLGFKSRGNTPANLYLDQIRLVKESRPAGVLAFDFGPDNQVLFPGFAPVSASSVYGKSGVKAGLRWSPSSNSARDDTFPTRLYQDFVDMGGNDFIVDLPNGEYSAWVVFDDCGYWGGEEARFHKRWIESNDRHVWEEDRGESGPADYLYRFEKIEPMPESDPWALYTSTLFQPRRFNVRAEDGKVQLRFRADSGGACKVAAVILYPAGDAQAEAWVKDVENRNRDEFLKRAVRIKTGSASVTPPAAAKEAGYWLGFPTLEEEILLDGPPGAEQGRLSRLAAQGQRVSRSFAVRPLKEEMVGQPQIVVSDLSSATATISAKEIDVRYVHHAMRRGFNDIAYSVGPETLRPVNGSDLQLKMNLTRQFWLTVHVPAGTDAGRYDGQVTLTAGKLKLSLPISVEVVGYALDEPQFSMGYYGTQLPREVRQAKGEQALRDLLQTLRDAGMNSLSGGPGIPFSGLDTNGKPKLDFRAADDYFKLVREMGFSQPLDGYGSLGMVTGLHGTYVIGETGRNWEKKTGKPFGELLTIVWSAVRDHAKEQDWPVVRLEFCDEPRVKESAEEELKLMKLYAEHAPWVNTGGSYSVQWNNDPLEKVLQEMFKTLHWSSLNLHTQKDVDMARELGKELLIYNQGRTRYSFGMYQWAEMHKGIRGRFQWHLQALHGYQFFDLDGREPDTAMIMWGHDGIIPTIYLPRCREGADDFRFAVTLWNLAQKYPNKPEAKEAINWLESINQQIPLNKNTRPPGLIGDDEFRAECARRIAALRR